MAKIKFHPSAKLADKYLELKARQAALAEEEDALKKALLKMGKSEIEGALARVTISECEGRKSYDAAALKRLVPAETLAQCEKIGAPSIRFAVKAKLVESKSVAA